MEEITNLNEITGRDLQRYKLRRHEDGDLNGVTMVTQLSTLEVLIGWCENIDAVAPGTRLKNEGEGERFVVLSQSVCDALDAYLKYNRERVVDEHDGNPLFTSRHERPAKSSLRDGIYRITRPCQYTGDCSHDREIDSREAVQWDEASKCPSGVSPHAIRRGAITKHLASDVPDEVMSDGMNVSLDILEKHYDRRGK